MNSPLIQPNPARANIHAHYPKLTHTKCLAETKHMTQVEWLEVRRKGNGSNDCAAACGLNPYMSMLELWMIKTGWIQQNIENESEGHTPLYWGKQLEPLVAEYYSMHTNYKLRRVNAVLQHPDPDKHFMLANLDYSVRGVMPMFKFSNVKPQGNMAPNYGVMVFLYTCCVRYNINWR
ncbi:hypothetical protein Acal02_01375 [Acinetobacter calcoaceticus]